MRPLDNEARWNQDAVWERLPEAVRPMWAAFYADRYASDPSGITASIVRLIDGETLSREIDGERMHLRLTRRTP